MEITDKPVNAADAYANAAEEYAEKGELVNAMEAHFKAAEQYLLAIENTSDVEAIRTLRLLNSSHQRQGKELERKIGKPASSPASFRGVAPSKHVNPISPSSRLRPTVSPPATFKLNPVGAHDHITAQDISHRATPSGNPKFSFSNQMDGNPGNIRKPAFERRDTNFTASPAQSITSRFDESSYMVLRNEDDDESDPFNKFWETVETLLQKLSSPAVAFTTAPLNENDPVIIVDPKTNNLMPINITGIDEEASAKVTSKKDSSDYGAATQMLESFLVIPDHKSKPNTARPATMEKQSDFALNRKAGILESVANITPTKTIEEYAIENQQLKVMIDQLSKKLMAFEKNAVETNNLKNSFIQIRQEIEKAKLARKSQDHLMRSSNISLRPSNVPERGNPDNSVLLQKKLKEYQELITLKDEEIRNLRIENDKQKMSVAKYKGKFSALMESAKKRQQVRPPDSQAPQVSRRSSNTTVPENLESPPFV